MQDDSPRKAAGFPKRTSPWIWIVLAIFLLLLITPILGRYIFGHPHSSENRIKSASNLREIGQAIMLYTNTSHGDYPDTFDDLLGEDIALDAFVSPGSSDTPATGTTMQAIAANFAMPGHCSYVYLGKGLSTPSQQPAIVVAYEPPAFNAGQGGNVLFADGHVVFVDMTGMNSILNQIKGGTWPVCLPAMPPLKP